MVAGHGDVEILASKLVTWRKACGNSGETSAENPHSVRRLIAIRMQSTHNSRVWLIDHGLLLTSLVVEAVCCCCLLSLHSFGIILNKCAGMRVKAEIRAPKCHNLFLRIEWVTRGDVVMRMTV